MFFRVFFEHELKQIFIVWEKLRVSDELEARSTFGGGGGSGGGWWSERVSVPNKQISNRLLLRSSCWMKI